VHCVCTTIQLSSRLQVQYACKPYYGSSSALCVLSLLLPLTLVLQFFLAVSSISQGPNTPIEERAARQSRPSKVQLQVLLTSSCDTIILLCIYDESLLIQLVSHDDMYSVSRAKLSANTHESCLCMLRRSPLTCLLLRCYAETSSQQQCRTLGSATYSSFENSACLPASAKPQYQQAQQSFVVCSYTAISITVHCCCCYCAECSQAQRHTACLLLLLQVLQA
jgi:Ca2+/H+ antiporter